MRSYESFFRKIEEILKKNDKFYIYADKDGDGVTSLILFLDILKRLGKKYNYKIAAKYEISKLKKEVKKYDALVIVDKPIHDKIIFQIAEENPSLHIIYIDHHKRKVPDNLPRNVIYLDIRALGFDVTSCSGVVYRLGKYLFEDFDRNILIASVGAYLDYFLYRDSLLLRDLEKYFGREMNIQVPFLLMLASLAIEAFADESSTKLIDSILRMDNLFIGLFSGKSASAISKWIKKYFKLLSIAFKNLKIEKNVIYTFVYNNASLVANILSEIYNDKIVLVFAPYTSNILEKILARFGIFQIYKVSIRSRTIDCGAEIQKFIKLYGLSGGGHPEAAGARIYKKDWKKLVSFFNQLCY